MRAVRLYGNIAAVIHDGKNMIRAVNGVIEVPPLCVNQALAMGFSRTPPLPIMEESALAKISAPNVVGLIPADVEKFERTERYRQEARDAGFGEDAAIDAIVNERLQFDDLVADGATPEEAHELVWPSPTLGAVLLLGEVAAAGAKANVEASVAATTGEGRGTMDDRITTPESAAAAAGVTSEPKPE